MVELGADRAKLRAFVSPCISQRHFEVGPEVADQFAPEFVAVNPVSGKQHVDLRGALVAQLEDAGLSRGDIEVSADCTYRDTHNYFSYRAEKGNTGRMMGFIGLK
jgi:copper oxidase (laccase) domain-containing protein